MSEQQPSRVQFWGIREPELQILYIITDWFNGTPLWIRGEKRRIATHHDLPLEELFRATDCNYELHEHAHERLLNNGLLQEEYVCRRKIDWGPTQQGLEAIRDVLKHCIDRNQVRVYQLLRILTEPHIPELAPHYPTDFAHQNPP